ncbi:MAG: nucleotidyltransferase domain-containing protein [Oligoflexia bacterium]|nr:nucleotidyltransferase domain-containing protein [Oligoflexia bacterium]
MTSLIKNQTQFELTNKKLNTYLDEICKKLDGRVAAAYIFGSAADNTITKDSDIDLILVVNETNIPFVQRGFEFIDLHDIYPKIDILVYTQRELDEHLKDSALGFWKSAKASMKQIL